MLSAAAEPVGQPVPKLKRRSAAVSALPSSQVIGVIRCQSSLRCTCRQACTASMNLSDEVDLEDYVARPDKISNAEIAAICQEAGMHAVRKNRYVILPKDFEKGYKANVKKNDTEFEFYQ